MALQGEYEPSPVGWVREQVERYEATDGREANTLRDTGYPIVVITSVGSRSGKLRKNPVMRVERGGRYVAIASKGGAPEDPVWAHNVRAHPVVDLQDGAERRAFDVRELAAGSPERDHWWQVAVDTWPTYATYEERAGDRVIPVFLLEPRG
jgi:deazaflavin-dependent oxidoreductase (nitroreductase family)